MRHKAQIAPDSDRVEQQRRSVDRSVKSPAGTSPVKPKREERAEMAKQPTQVFDDLETETLQKFVADPGCNPELLLSLKALLKQRTGDEVDDEEGAEIAASFGGRVPADSFVRHCEQTYKNEQRAAAAR